MAIYKKNLANNIIYVKDNELYFKSGIMRDYKGNNIPRITISEKYDSNESVMILAKDLIEYSVAEYQGKTKEAANHLKKGIIYDWFQIKIEDEVFADFYHKDADPDNIIEKWENLISEAEIKEL